MGLNKLILTPGEHAGQLSHEGRELTALFALGAKRAPSASISGHLVVPARVRGFPQRLEFPRLAGRLNNNLEIVLREVAARVWFPESNDAQANMALVGLDAIAGDAEGFHGFRLQTTELPLFLGFSPWAELTHPAGLEGEYLAKSAAALSRSWNHDRWSMNAGYGITFPYDAYNFRLPASPYIEVRSTHPLSATEWWDYWISPLQEIISLAVRQPIDVATVYLLRQDGDTWRRTQLFHRQILQEPLVAERPDPLARSSLQLVSDDWNPLELTQNWLRLRDAYGSSVDLLMTGLLHPELPIRARYLYLAQAAESLDSSVNGVAPITREDFKSQRASVLEALKTAQLHASTVKWLRRWLTTRPDYTLEQRLRRLIKQLPGGALQPADAKPLADLRNRLSHGDASDSTSFIGQQLVRLEALLVARLFQLADTPAAAVVDALDRRLKLVT